MKQVSKFMHHVADKFTSLNIF